MTNSDKWRDWKVKEWLMSRVLMYWGRMNLKAVRMCRVGFVFFLSALHLHIKINGLHEFCAPGYTSDRSKSKTNEIANVCEHPNSFMIVMFVGVLVDNALSVLLTC
ncbi:MULTISPECIES: hypothetical protein [Burkholderia cepacia complex]|uniref:hypothetical protein n=1 Tax=Burkholderia cepacia complex TaxID=87882 RepID=UPI001CF5AF52|nr:hypothetical protein [Burkholderia cenocepacia]MCA7926789.1 hypothetical protein [Burkholderia cenocepacia]